MKVRALLLIGLLVCAFGCSGKEEGGYTQADIDKAAKNPGAENMIGGEPMSRGGEPTPTTAPQGRKFGVGK
jgi:hypothetical protein